MSLALLCAFASACGGVEPITSCEPKNNVMPVCMFKNPEDIVALPGSVDTLVISEFGSMDGSKPGRLVTLEPQFSLAKQLYPLFDSRIGHESRAGGMAPPSGPGRDVGVVGAEQWGDPACPGPPGPDFAPHGIDLRVRADGRTQLAVVNHGGRESVELLELIVAGVDSSPIWRGCAIAPEDGYFNDVVLLGDGGFLVTHMYPRSSPWKALLAMFGWDTGWVYEWHANSGFEVVAGTDGAFPNGIEVSHDDTEIFLNVYGASEVRRISRETGETLAVANVSHPDNISWNEAGDRLLVASHTGSFRQMLGCGSIEEGSCPLPSEVLSLGPETLDKRLLFATEGDPMGAITVAIERGGHLWFGTFAGDRIGVFALRHLQDAPSTSPPAP